MVSDAEVSFGIGDGLREQSRQSRVGVVDTGERNANG